MLNPPLPLTLGVVLTLLSSSSMAQTEVSRLPVENFRVLLVTAIDSPTGQAHGILVGPMIDALTSKIKASSPVLIDVTTLRRYQQEGCRRLNVRFWQQGVVLPGKTIPQDQTFDLGLNFCRDGLPPKSLS